MTYLLIAVGVLREVTSREPQCMVALAAGILSLLLTMRRQALRRIVHSRQTPSASAAPEGVGVTASVR